MVNEMSSDQKPLASFILSLLSGAFIIFTGVICSFYWDTDMPMSWMDGMMHGWEENMHMWNIGGMAFAMTVLGIVFGMIILVSAIMLYLSPTQHQLWGALIIAFSVISVLSCMGGMGIGLILGIIGGILGILWKPQESKQSVHG